MAQIDLHEAASEALSEIGAVAKRTSPESIEAFMTEIAAAKTMVLHGLGREGLMMKAFAMRLFHLGLDAHVLGDMTTPPLGEGDLLIVSAGPGWFSSISALCEIAHESGARIACITAQPDDDVSKTADFALHIPAQTMADDLSETVSVLPMGSLFEGAQFLIFELVVIMLRDRMGETSETMRRRHTNME